MVRRADGIAHVMQAIEKGDQIVAAARIILRFGHFKFHAVETPACMAASWAMEMEWGW